MVPAGDAQWPAAQRADVAEMLGVWSGDEGWVTWRVSSAWGTAGFFIYRIDPASGVETRLNDQLVPVAFGQADATYTLVDPAASEGGAGTYRLEEAELSGALLDLGVHTVVFAPPPADPESPAAAPRPRALRRDVPPPSPTSSVLRVTLRKEGLYGVSLESIAAGMGLSLEAVQDLAEADSLCIRSQGRPVPTLHDAGRDRLVFHGQPTSSWYARDAAYLISVGEGMAMPRQNPGATNGATVVPVQVRIEEDRLPLDSVVQMPEDFYYWDYVISTTDPASNRVDFVLGLEGYEGGPLTVTVDLQGWSKTATQNPDHHAEFSLNGTPVGVLAFDDQQLAAAELSIPSGLASNGLNVLTVRGALPTNYTHSFFVVDGVTAAYDRSVSPGAEAMYFQAGAATAFSAQAYTEPLVIALDWERWFPVWIADASGEIPDKAWAVAEGNDAFAVIEADAVPMLEPEPAAADAWFMAETNQIDYLVITTRALAEAAQELADYRAGQGYRVGVALFEDICDLLYDGLRDPEAIREFMSFAGWAWPAPPQMAVLAGNGNYDYLGTLSNEVNQLPPMLVQTYDGFFASDELLGDCGGDPLPEVAIGRLPAQTAGELTAMIAKIKSYESEFGAAWQNEWTFAADKYDYLAGNFPASNVRLAAGVGGPYSVAMQFDLDTTSIATARANWASRFNAGSGFMHYTGHGSPTKYSAQGLMTTTDIQAMTNARPAVVVALCCLSGRFEAPGVDSMSEALLQRAGGGAVAVWASSGMSRNGPATDLAEAVYRDVIEAGSGTLGLSILRARRELPEDLFNRDTFATFNLMGDPALRIAGNTGGHPEPLAIAPVFTETTVQSATVGVALAFTVGATGAPLPVLELRATTVPSGYSFSAETGQLTYTPAAGDLGLQTFSFTASNTAGVATQTVEVVVAGGVPGTPQLVLSTTNVNVREAGEGRFHVRLSAAPTASVAVAIAPFGGDTNLWIQDGAALTFTPANWQAWQVVTLAAGEDENIMGETASFQISAPGAADQWVGATALDDDLGPNMALASGGATISGGSLSSKVIDGIHLLNSNYAYLNCTSAPPGALILNLKGAAEITRVRVLNWDWDVRAHRYQIETSDDGMNWTMLVDASGEDHRGWDDWAVDASAHYLRFTALSNSVNALLAITEWEVYGHRPAPLLNTDRVNVRENGEGRFFVRLGVAPMANTTVTVAHVQGDADLAVQAGGELVFNSANWSLWQMVTLAAAADENAAAGVALFRISTPGAVDQYVEATELDDDLGPNMALASGGATIAGGALSSKVIDGIHLLNSNYAYMYWTNVPPGALTLNLKGAVEITRVRVLNWDWDVRTHRYQIEASDDGVNWTMLVDASGEDRRGWDDWPVDASARYLRLTALSNSVNALLAIAEWEVYGHRPAPLLNGDSLNVRENGEGRFFVRLGVAPVANTTVTVARVQGDADLAVQNGGVLVFNSANWSTWQMVTLTAADDADADSGGGTFRISTPDAVDQFVAVAELDDDIGTNLALASRGTTISGGSLSAKAIDGIHLLNSNYAYLNLTNAPLPMWTMDLKSVQAISQVRLLNWNWDWRVHRYTIESSTDGVNWTMLVDASGEDRRGWDDWNVAATARYLRFQGLSNSMNSVVAISEWEVYGPPLASKRSHVSAVRPPKAPIAQPPPAAVAAPDAAGRMPDVWPVLVVTSDGGAEDPAGWAALDGDPETGWTGQLGAGGWFIAVGYGDTVVATNLVVEVVEGCATQMQCLISMDAVEWAEWTDGKKGAAVEFNYLWLLFTAEEGSSAVPQVVEIQPQAMKRPRRDGGGSSR